jgi:hypothetical protein
MHNFKGSWLKRAVVTETEDENQENDVNEGDSSESIFEEES